MSAATLVRLRVPTSIDINNAKLDAIATRVLDVKAGRVKRYANRHIADFLHAYKSLHVKT